MLALCFVSRGLENQHTEHLGTRSWFPQIASDSTPFWWKKEHATKERCGWWTGWDVPDKSREGATNSLQRENTACLCNRTNGNSRNPQRYPNKADKHACLKSPSSDLPSSHNNEKNAEVGVGRGEGQYLIALVSDSLLHRGLRLGAEEGYSFSTFMLSLKRLSF